MGSEATGFPENNLHAAVQHHTNTARTTAIWEAGKVVFKTKGKEHVQVHQCPPQSGHVPYHHNRNYEAKLERES